MDISIARRAAVVLLCLVLFSTCGDLETLFPTNETYQVRTLVNGSSLEDCSIIRSSDKIRPYFAISVVNDPDLIGLLVYLQDSQGKIIGDKVQYTLLAYASETALTEADLQEEEEQDEADDPADKVEKEDDDESDLPELQVRERWSFTDAKQVAKKSDVEIAVRSLSTQLPYFPLPKDLEIGPYVLIFEALGKKETLSRTETNVFYLGNAEFNLKDISMYLSGLSGPQLISPETVILLETKLDFDSRLDPYVIWYNGKAILSEGKISDGAGNILWKAPEEAGFYSLRLEVFPFHLKRTSYTGVSREIALPVSPKAISLGYFFENNQKYTARSPLSAGTAYPEHIKLAAAMIQDEGTPHEDAPRENTPREEIQPGGTPPGSIPAVSYPEPELLQWYQFEGSLHDSLSTSTLTSEPSLMPINESPTRWAAAGQSYGLSIGPDDPYLLSPIKFFHEETDQGGGIILLHIRPLSEGTIFKAFFPLESSLTEGVSMDMVKKENVITLRLNATDAFVDLPVYLPLSAAEGFTPIAVEFYIRPYRLEAKISLEDYIQNNIGFIKLSDALSGEVKIQLGSEIQKSILDKPVVNKPAADKSILDKSNSDKLNSDKPVSDKLNNETAAVTSNLTVNQSEAPLEEATFKLTALTGAEELNTNIPAVVETLADTIWDELAILFSAVPLLPEEPLETDADKKEDAAAQTAGQYETNFVDTKPVDKKPADSKPVDPKPVVTKPVDKEPADTVPADTASVTVDVPLDAAEADDADTISVEDPDADNSVQEQETLERTDL